MRARDRDDHRFGELDGLRVLISFEPGYGAYGHALARAIRARRATVELVKPEEVEGAAARLEPHLVITDRRRGNAAPARLELSTDPDKPSTFSLRGRTREALNPSFDELLAFLDEVGRSAGENRGWDSPPRERGSSGGSR